MRGLVAIAAAGVALTGPAAASAETGGVRDGAARFEVLTPTLIRLEYAADGRFQDGPTFNVPSRHFAATRFHTSVEHGYRVIDTGRVTLRYREGSGPFTAANTTVPPVTFMLHGPPASRGASTWANKVMRLPPATT